MKHSKKTFVFALLAAVMLITCLLCFGGTAAEAVAPGLVIGSNTIYYFTDLYPTLHEEVLFEEFGDDYDIVYDHQGVTKDMFTYMVNQGYFTGFYASCVVIIDIKTFIPDDTALNNLFTSLDNQGCKTVFVTSYPDDVISSCGADITFHDTELERLGMFISDSLADLQNDNDTLENTFYLIDNTWGEVLNFYNGDVTEPDLEMICNAYPPLRVFIEELLDFVLADVSISDDTCADTLSVAGIRVQVYTGNGGYIDILTGNGYSTDEIVNTIITGDDNAPNTCAFGIWAFQTSYYQSLHYIQRQNGYPLPIYALIVDPLLYDEDGLILSGGGTDVSFEIPTMDEAARELLEALWQLLN